MQKKLKMNRLEERTEKWNKSNKYYFLNLRSKQRKKRNREKN